MEKRNNRLARVLLSALLLALLFSLFACAGGTPTSTTATTEPADGKPAAFCDGMIIDRFRSVGIPPCAIPVGVTKNDDGYYISAPLFENDYLSYLTELRKNGFTCARTKTGAFLFRDDCAVFLHNSASAFELGFYRTGVGAPKDGVTVAEVKEKLCPKNSLSTVAFHPIDVTPKGFYERTGGQFFAVPTYSFDGYAERGQTEMMHSEFNERYSCAVYFVRGNNVSRVGMERAAVADVDGDGEEEVFLLSSGPTSGLFSIVLTMIDGEDAVGWFFDFGIAPGTLYFTEQDGNLFIRDEAQYPETEYLYEIRLDQRDGETAVSLFLQKESRRIDPNGTWPLRLEFDP